MKSEAPQQPAVDPSVISRLACPVCQAELRPDEARLVCAGCGLSYPIENGIPVLIADRATRPQE
jgi:hypothetical protein